MEERIGIEEKRKSCNRGRENKKEIIIIGCERGQKGRESDPVPCSVTTHVSTHARTYKRVDALCPKGPVVL